VDGVVLNLSSDEEVRNAYRHMVKTAAQRRPEAEILGVTVQEMITDPNGFELIVGTKKDPVFGAVIMVGTGGTAAEVFRDRALSLPPLNEALARRMLKSLKSWPLLQGYRGKPAANVDRLIEILIRFSYLVADYPEIKELDVNPLLVTPQDVVALDARVIIDRDLAVGTVRPFSHLAIRPYPEEFVTERKMKDGTPVILRPIKPEDEPLWHELLASCSSESLRYRFSYMFKQTTHEMATRYCFLDYDREIGIVAEVEEDGERTLIGVGRLVADMNHDAAEYAVIVVDRWHGRGLGKQLTEYCLEVAKGWGVKRVVAETSKQNSRMLATFRGLGFELDDQQAEDVVMVHKDVQ
jgi:acetyltransferase